MELVVPLLVLAPRRIGFFAAFPITLLQGADSAHGKHAFFNFLTIALCRFAFDDQALGGVLPKKINTVQDA